MEGKRGQQSGQDIQSGSCVSDVRVVRFRIVPLRLLFVARLAQDGEFAFGHLHLSL